METNNRDSLSERDLEKIGKLFDEKFKPFATRTELDAKLFTLEKSLKTYVNEGIEAVLAGMEAMENRIIKRDRVKH